MIPAFLLALALQASFEDRFREHNCSEPMSQMDMTACEGIAFERADAELNALWREVVAGARAADAEIDRTYDDRPTSEAKLREAQRAWIVFRDAHCAYEAYESRGGTMEPMLYQACRAALTRQRIRQLTRPTDPER